MIRNLALAGFFILIGMAVTQYVVFVRTDSARAVNIPAPVTLKPGDVTSLNLKCPQGTAICSYPGAINRSTFDSIEQALTDRDDRVVSWHIEIGNTLPVPSNATVKIVSIDRHAAHVQLTDGRRAYIPVAILAQG